MMTGVDLVLSTAAVMLYSYIMSYSDIFNTLIVNGQWHICHYNCEVNCFV